MRLESFLWLVLAGLMARISFGADSTTDEVVIDLINRSISEVWSEYGLRPTSRAQDNEWCRRVFLDLLGRIPTAQELADFLRDRAPDRRRDLVVRLQSESYLDEYSRHWADIWASLLIGRTGGSEDDSLISREGMNLFLVESLRRNQRYDELVTELITAKGTTAPGSSNFNGATNFLVMKIDDNAVQATSQTARLFLGTQVQCTQCHNHPFNEWRQNQFWELNSFFRQAVALRRYASGSDMIREVELADQDFAGEGNHPTDAEVYFEQRNGVLQVAYPVFLDGTPLPNRSGLLTDVNRREAVARLIRQSPLLERAQVNRMWKYFLGYGLSEPVDDLGPHRAVSHPELLLELSTAFRKNGFDLHQLVRWIVLSEPYSLSSHGATIEDGDNPARAETPKFSRFYLRQMSPEQLYASLSLLATSDVPAPKPGTSIPDRSLWLGQFARSLGDDEGNESISFNGTIPQTLMMFNGEFMAAATSTSSANRFTEILLDDCKLPQKIDQLYLTALSRRPHPREKKRVLQLVEDASASESVSAWSEAASNGSDEAQPTSTVVASLQDVWWALLNSNEFILIH